jgi:hypothetical protein
MSHRRLIPFALAMLLCPAVAWAQGLVIDLAAVDVGKTTTLPIAPRGEGTLTIINLVSTKKYSYEVKLVTTPIDPLSRTTPAGTPPTICNAPIQLVNLHLNEAQDEQDVSKAISDLLKLVEICPLVDQPRIRAEAIAEITRLTVRTFPIPAIGLGQRLEVVITESKRTWTVVFSTGPRGSWRVMSALAFTRDGSDTFHTAGEGTSFQIIKDKRDPWDINLVPSLLFTWLPAARENSSHSHGFTAGLGFHKTYPSVLVGYQWTFNQNIGLAGGVMAQRVTRLARQYEGDALPAVKEKLEAGQLVRETYRPRIFLAVTIRLNTPFSGVDETPAPKK